MRQDLELERMRLVRHKHDLTQHRWAKNKMILLDGLPAFLCHNRRPVERVDLLRQTPQNVFRIVLDDFSCRPYPVAKTKRIFAGCRQNDHLLSRPLAFAIRQVTEKTAILPENIVRHTKRLRPRRCPDT